MELFSISCTTCGARLKVRSVAAIGQILACPKCQSMVEITPPDGWSPPASPALPHESTGAASSSGVSMPPVVAPDVASHDKAASSMVSQANMAKPAASDERDSDFASTTNEPSAGEPAEVAATKSEAAALSPLERVSRRVTVVAVGLAAVAVFAFAAWRPGNVEKTALGPEESSPPTSRAENLPAPGNRVDAAPEVATDAVAATQATTPTDEDISQPDINGAAEPEPAKIPLPDRNNVRDDGTDDMLVGPNGAEKPTLGTPAPPDPAKQPAATAVVDGDDEHVASTPSSDRVAGDLETELTSERSAADQHAAARLEERLLAIDFQKAKLSDLVEFLARMANVAIEFDQPSLVAADVEPDVRVSVKLADTNVGQVLDLALAKLGLKHEIRDGQVLIVTRPDLSERQRGGAPDPPRVVAADELDAATTDAPQGPKSDLRLPAARSDK